jgi:translation elongation factor EF-Ts
VLKHNAKVPKSLTLRWKTAKTVQEHITNLIGKIGEKVIVSTTALAASEGSHPPTRKPSAGSVSFPATLAS